jgi:hypothetical protein
MSIYKFKRLTLAEGGYHNIHATTKKGAERKQRHKITLQIDDDNLDLFHSLVENLDEQIEEAKAELGWGEEHSIRLPYNLETNTLELAWNDLKHGQIKFVEAVEGELVELTAEQVPNIHSGTLLNVGLSARSSASQATNKYKERVWINVEPDVIYLLDVKLFERSSAYDINKEDLYKDLEADALDF